MQKGDGALGHPADTCQADQAGGRQLRPCASGWPGRRTCLCVSPLKYYDLFAAAVSCSLLAGPPRLSVCPRLRYFFPPDSLALWLGCSAALPIPTPACSNLCLLPIFPPCSPIRICFRYWLSDCSVCPTSLFLSISPLPPTPRVWVALVRLSFPMPSPTRPSVALLLCPGPCRGERCSLSLSPSSILLTHPLTVMLQVTSGQGQQLPLGWGASVASRGSVHSQMTSHAHCFCLPLSPSQSGAAGHP